MHPHRRPDSEVGAIALDLMLDERILDVVTELIGPALAAQSMFYFKPPTARGQALHQDNLYLQAHPETCIAAWIAVDDCDADNGGLAVVPGSHVIHVIVARRRPIPRSRSPTSPCTSPRASRSCRPR